MDLQFCEIAVAFRLGEDREMYFSHGEFHGDISIGDRGSRGH